MGANAPTVSTTPLQQQLPSRIVIVGAAGSGKTTLAAQLVEILSLPHVEMDALHWGPEWSKPSRAEFRQRVRVALAGPLWVTDGNYSKVRDIVWGQATDLVWLDYSLLLVWRRLFWRAVRRVYHQEELWHGNKESWRGQFFSRDSLFLYAYTSRKRQRRRFPVFLCQPAYAHLRLHRFYHPQKTETWLQQLAGS